MPTLSMPRRSALVNRPGPHPASRVAPVQRASRAAVNVSGTTSSLRHSGMRGQWFGAYGVLTSWQVASPSRRWTDVWRWARLCRGQWCWSRWAGVWLWVGG